MMSFSSLERDLQIAKQQNLIDHVEYVKNCDYIIVKLKVSTPMETRKKLRECIRTCYAGVGYCLLSPHDNSLYISFNS